MSDYTADDAQNMGGNMHDGDGITDDQDHGFRNTVLAIFGIVIAAALAFFGWSAYQQSQLPAAFIAAHDDTVVAHTKGDMKMAITVAKRVKRPIVVTEMCGAPRPAFPDRPCGVSFESTDYGRLSRLTGQTDTIRMVIELQPFDIVDARHGEFVPANDRAAQARYFARYGKR